MESPRPAPRGVLALAALFLGTCGATNQPIWLTSIQPFTGADWDAGISMRIGGQIMVEEINANPNLLPGYELKVAWQDGLCAKPVGTQRFLENIFDKTYKVFAPGKTLAELDADGDGTVTTADTDPMSEVWDSTQVNPPPVGLLGSGCAGTALNIANIAYMARFPMVSNSATRPGLSDRGTYPILFRTIMPDTTFNAAWIAMSKILGQTSIAIVIADTENWASMGTAIVAASQAQNVQLMGNDLGGEIAGLHGMQVSLDSQAMAKTAAADLIKYKQRVVILLMFHRRNRLVLCEAYKSGFVNAVYMPMGWLPFGWWSIPDTDCQPAQLTGMAMSFISANMMFWRGDMDTQLSCSSSMTARQFVDEWFNRQGGTHGDLSMRPEGYAPALEAATTADAACMYATMLHEVLLTRNIALSELTDRTQNGYDNIFDVLSNTDFEGVQGRVRFQPGFADPAGFVIMQQLQDDAGTLKLLDIASYNAPTFNFLDKGDLVFQYPGEVFSAGPAGATTISAALTPFVDCTGNQMPDFSTNMCVDCPVNTEFVQFAGACLCVAGFYATGSGCSPCPGGTFSTSSGALACSVCEVGKYAPEGSTLCTFCPRGTYSNTTGLEVCHGCPALKTTDNIASEEVAACVCAMGAYSTGDECRSCPPNATTSGLSSPSVDSCLCPEHTYFRDMDCKPCPAGSTTIGIGKTAETSCHCEQGNYLPLGGTSCEECPDGMSCPKGSNAVNTQYITLAVKSTDQQFPKLKARYWASLSDPLSVFQCDSEAKCPGDRDPGNACAPHLQLQACEHCQEGYHWSGTACEECASIEQTKFLFPILPMIFVPIIIVGMYKLFGDFFIKWGSWQNGMACILFIMLNHYQTIDILAATNIVFQQTSRDVFQIWMFTNNMASIFKLDCMGLADFKASLIIRGVTPPILGVCCAVAFGLSWLIAMVTKKEWLAMQRDRLLNVFGSMMITFFSAIAALSLLLFKCSENPNGVTTLTVDLSIICFDSEEWKNMLAAAIVFVVVYIIGMGGLFVRTVLIAPKQFSDPCFQMRWKFLFIKFRADVYWWSIAFLAKNFFVNLAFVVTVGGVGQLYLVMAFTTAYLGGVVLVNPYRHRIANLLEVAACVSIVYASSLLTWHADRKEGTLDYAIDVSTAVVSFLPVFVAAGCMLFMFMYGNKYPIPPEQVQAAQREFKEIAESCRALTYLSNEDGVKMVLQLADWDRWYLLQAAHAIKTDVVGGDSSKRVVDRSLSQFLSTGLAEGKRKSEFRKVENGGVSDADANANGRATAVARTLVCV